MNFASLSGKLCHLHLISSVKKEYGVMLIPTTSTFSVMTSMISVMTSWRMQFSMQIRVISLDPYHCFKGYEINCINLTVLVFLFTVSVNKVWKKIFLTCAPEIIDVRVLKFCRYPLYHRVLKSSVSLDID